MTTRFSIAALGLALATGCTNSDSNRAARDDAGRSEAPDGSADDDTGDDDVAAGDDDTGDDDADAGDDDTGDDDVDAGDDDTGDDDAGDDAGLGEMPDAGPDTGDGGFRASGIGVQDMWVLHDLHAVLEDGSVVSLLPGLTELAFDASQDAVAISQTATFRPAPALDTHMRNLQGEVRGDMVVTGGVIEDGDSVMVTLFATAAAGTPLPSTQDMLAFTLPTMQGLDEGTPLLSDYQFVQVLPDVEADERAGQSDPLALLAERLLAESYQFPAAGDEVDPEDLVFLGQLGEVLGDPVLPRDVRLPTAQRQLPVLRQEDGNGETGGMPPKARPYFDGFNGGLGKCLARLIRPGQSSLKCVKDVLDGQQKGARGSADMLKQNLGNDPAPTPEPHVPEASDGPCTEKCASGGGDPHLYTFDRQAYDLQLVGEFVAARSSDVEVQVRTGALRDLQRVSFVTRVAARVGGHVVEIPPDREAPIRIDGEAVPVRAPGAEPLRLDDVEVWWTMNGVDVLYEGDALMRVRRQPSYLDFYVQGGQRQWEGLFGDNDGDRTDGLATRQGDEVEARTSPELYEEIGASWRLRNAESLFTYEDGANTATYTDESFPDEIISLDDLDPVLRAKAERVCQMAGIHGQPGLNDCILDFALTGDISLVHGVQSAQAAKRAPEIEDHSVLDEYVQGNDLRFEGETLNETTGSQHEVGEGLLLLRTSSPNDELLHAIDLVSGRVRWTISGIDSSCKPVIVDGLGVAVQLDESQDTVEGRSSPPMVLLSFHDGSEQARAADAPDSGCTNALSVSGPIVLQASRTAVTAYDAENGMAQIWTAATDDTHFEYAPGVEGHFAVWGRNLSVSDPLTLRLLNRETGVEVDSLTVMGGAFTELDRVGKNRLALTANTSADGPRATSIVTVAADGTLELAWARDFSDETETSQPRRLTELGPHLVGWGTVGALPEVIAFDGQTGEVAWRYEPPSNDPAAGLIETALFGNAVAIGQISGDYLHLVGATGELVGHLPESPSELYSQPLVMTSLPDGRLVTSGRVSNPSGTYVHFIKP